VNRPVYKITACVEPRLPALSEEQRQAKMILPEFAEQAEGFAAKSSGSAELVSQPQIPSLSG
jgi:hypothetical protein